MARRLALHRHPDAAARVREGARLRAALRAHLDGRGLVEADVPPWQPAAGQEPSLAPPRVDVPGLPSPLYLQTSPELALKHLLCAGVPALYALGFAFRGGREELSQQHQPAFTLLEWYRPATSEQALIDDVRALGRAASEALGRDAPADGRVVPVEEALRRWAALDPAPLLADDPAASRRAARSSGLPVRDDAEPLSVLSRALVERVEPALAALPGYSFLVEWPRSAAALAQLDDQQPPRARRVEAYLGGLELANGWLELLDPDAMAARWQGERAAREDGPPPPLDQTLLDALASTPPGPTVGMALGVDRLHAALVGATHLSDVLPLSLALHDDPDGAPVSP